jgi:hypothetical protein
MTTTVSGALVATAPVFTYTEQLALGLVHLLYLAPGVPEFSSTGHGCSQRPCAGRWCWR